MRYSTRTRYGLRLLVNLASRPADSCVQLAEIARDEGISVKYLEQIVRALRPSGILRSIRGARGGYALARPASEVFMDVMVEYLEGHIAPVDCLYADAPCPRQNTCSTRAFWLEMDRHMRAFLAGRRLPGSWRILRFAGTDAHSRMGTRKKNRKPVKRDAGHGIQQMFEANAFLCRAVRLVESGRFSASRPFDRK